MSKRMWFGMWGLSVVLPLAMVALCAAREHRVDEDSSLVIRWWDRPNIVRQLNISEGQLTTVREIADAQVRKIRLLQGTYLAEQKALKDLLIREILDDREIEHRVDALGVALLALSRAETDMTVAMCRELTADQRARLLPLIETLRQQDACSEKKQRKRNARRYNRF